MHIPEDKIVKTTGFAPKCLYCGTKCVLCCASLVYHGSQKYGHVWMCPHCEEPTYVGAHKQTLAPMGHPANASLRHWRREVHQLFDPLWNTVKNNKKRKQIRFQKYKELAVLMGLPTDLCHVAMFNESQALKAIELIKEGKIKKAT